MFYSSTFSHCAILNNHQMTLADSVAAVASAASKHVETVLGNCDTNASLLHTPAGELLDPATFIQALDTINTDFSVQIPDSASDSTETYNADTFKHALVTQSRAFALLTGLTKYVDDLMPEIMQSGAQPGEISEQARRGLEKLAVLLDAVLALCQTAELASLKSDFYALLATTVETLSQSLIVFDAFWAWPESRIERIRSTVFDPKVTLNRIAVLGLCNSITDKYYRPTRGKLDSYAKDTFHDVLHARVRLFVAELLDFDDLTGLNKYFALANRLNREPALGKAQSGDDQLLADVLSFRRLLRDPYAALKNTRQLSTHADSMSRLQEYFLDEEAKYARIHPARDLCAVEQPPSEDEKRILEHKSASVKFFPQDYWLAPFEQIQRGAHFDTVRAEDVLHAKSQFDSSKFRRLLLMQVYFASSFFSELSASRKKQLLANVHAPANAKHIVEDTVSDVVAGKFSKIKRDIFHRMRAWNLQFLFTLQHMAHSEELWWGWLIYGKLSDGKPLLASRTLSPEALAEVQEKYAKVAPFKTKRYFNSHGTPQLSRIMKTKTGLDLVRREEVAQTFDEEIAALSHQIEAAHGEERALLIEQRTVLHWKRLRGVREKSWLTLNSELTEDDIEETRADENVEEENGIAEETKDVDMEIEKEVKSATPVVEDEKVNGSDVVLEAGTGANDMEVDAEDGSKVDSIEEEKSTADADGQDRNVQPVEDEKIPEDARDKNGAATPSEEATENAEAVNNVTLGELTPSKGEERSEAETTESGIGQAPSAADPETVPVQVTVEVGPESAPSISSVRELPRESEPTTGGILGESMKESRKRHRSPEADEEEMAAKKIKAE